MSLFNKPLFASVLKQAQGNRTFNEYASAAKTESISAEQSLKSLKLV